MDTAERRLWCLDELIPLTPKQFDLLFYFIENAGTLAKKSTLLDAVWTDSYVDEATLARNISWLRKKLGECDGGEQFIETVPKLGYRFTATVTRPEKSRNSIIVEEQTIQHFRGEETITFDDADLLRKGEREKGRKGDEAKKISPSPFLSFFLSPRFLIAAFGLVVLAGSGFVIYQNYFIDSPPTAIVASNNVPFSGAPGYENGPAFSPDNRQLAYSWNGGEGTESDIYVKLIGVGEPLQLTKTTFNEHYPTFSPDGKYIAFVRGKYGEPGEVIIIPSLGGRERSVTKLFSGNYSISYSPDARHIAVIDTENSNENGQYAVYLVNIENGDRKRVTAPAEFIGETTPRFSPDGKNLAFIRIAKDANLETLGKQDLFTIPTSGGEPMQITFDGVIINSLAWSADGEHIYFVPHRPPNQTSLRRIPAGGGEQEIVSTGGKDITNIAVSTNGKKLVFAEDTRLWSIWRIPPDGEAGRRLIESNVNEFFPQFSPDNSRIAFQTDRTGITQIWTADTYGKNLRQITDMPFSVSYPQFSPDGYHIAFNQKKGKRSANFTIPISGGEARRISPEGGWEDFPTWSADGKYIYFTSDTTGEKNIWKTNADGSGEAIQITTIGAYRATPAPDGETVFFTKWGFPNEFWRVPANGGTEEIVPEVTAAGFFNIWIMSKTGVYFLSPISDKDFKLKFYDFADKQVKDAPGDYKIPPNLDGTILTTDGNILLCSVIEKASRLMLADLP